MTSDVRPLIFLSYSSPDRIRVDSYYSFLSSKNFRLWMDKHSLKGGQNWDFEIKRALDNSSIIIVFVSRHSIDRRGYLQKEIRTAMEHLKRKLIDDIFIIPILLDDVEIPPEFEGIHVLYVSSGTCRDDLVGSISSQFAALSSEATAPSGSSAVSWSFSKYTDTWEGLPGYDVSFQAIRLYSSEYPYLEEIQNVVSGHFAQEIMSQRSVMFRPSDNEQMNFGKPKYWRTNLYEATCTGVSIAENVVSIEYTIYWFGAGAAHGNTYYKTFVFLIHPTIFFRNCADLFTSPDEALAPLQAKVRACLLELRIGEDPENEFALEEEWVKQGTSCWDDFAAFVFVEEGLRLTFAPYSVACFAAGSHTVIVPWKTLRPYMKPLLLSALGREFEHFDEKSEEEQQQMHRDLGITKEPSA